MQVTPQPLLIRPPILPGESLFSFLIRLSQSNSYTSPNVLRDLVLETLDTRRHHRYVKDILNFPRKSETYSRIADLTLIDPFTLYKSTHHRFALVLTPPPRLVNYLTLPDKTSVPCFPDARELPQIRSINASQFCPKCLQEMPCHLLNWLPVSLSACLKHECLLVDQCPNCYKKVSHYAVVAARCSECKSDLTKANAVSIADDEIGLRAQRILQSWFMDYVTPKHEITNLVQPPAILYRIIEGLQNSIEVGKGEQWFYLHSLPSYPERLLLPSQKDDQVLTPYASYCIHATACKVIMNWPENFFQFLLGYCKKSEASFQSMRYEPYAKNKRLAGSIRDNLGVLYTRWIKQYWSYPEFSFVQEAFDYHIANNYQIDNFLVRTKPYQKNLSPQKNPVLVEHTKYVSILVAANLLNTSPEVIKLLQRNKLLTQVVEGGHELVDRQEVQSYCYEWNRLVSSNMAGLLMGVPYRVIDELTTFGIIPKEPARKRDPGRHFKIAEVMTFLEKLSRCVKSFSPQEIFEKDQWIPFAKADQIFTYKEALQSVTILLQILEGNLTAYHPLDAKFQIKSFLFAPDDFKKCRERLRDQSMWLERQEVLNLLGIKYSTLTQWMRDGRIFPIAMYKLDKYFDAEKIYELCSRYVTQKEAACILAVNVPTLQNWIRANEVPELLIGDPNGEGESARIFDREQVVGWRNEHLTSSEAVQVLGVTKATLSRWVKKGKLRPLDVVSGNQYWFDKQAVINLMRKEDGNASQKGE
jgi:excisionase family DNA binding protein